MKKNEPLIEKLHIIIRWSVRVLAVLMVIVIVMGVLDVGWTLFQKMTSPPRYILTITELLATFGAFLAVLIAIEIFTNITVYLREDIIKVRIVMATALMAIARKVIVLDPKKVESEYLFGIAAIMIATSIGFWLVAKAPKLDLLQASNKGKKKLDKLCQEGKQ